MTERRASPAQPGRPTRRHVAAVPKIPPELIDERTGTLRFCPASRAYLAERLLADPHADLKVALAGLEPLFDKIFQNLNFAGVSFRTQDLVGLNFAGCNFDGAIFDLALIQGTGFRGARVPRDRLTRAKDWVDAVIAGYRSSMATMGTSQRPSPMAPPSIGSWARFSEAHHMPELMMLPPDLDVTKHRLTTAETLALRECRLAISCGPITKLDLAMMLPEDVAIARLKHAWTKRGASGDTGQAMSDFQSARADHATAAVYVQSLNQQCHAGYGLPSAGLLLAAHRAAQRIGAPFWTGSEGELATDGTGAPIRTGWAHPALPVDPAVTFDQHPFRVVRQFEDTNK